MPLDLHVLGLSLAFILSQDQTLRCYISTFSFFFFIWLGSTFVYQIFFHPEQVFFCLTSFHSSFSLVSLVLTVYLYRNYFNVRSISMPSSLNTHLRFPSKASAKLIPFFKLPKYF